MLVAESTSAVTFVCPALCLFGHEVGDHVGRRSESGGDIAQLDMLAAEVDAHVDVERIWFVGGVKYHDSAFIVAEEHGRERLSEAEITKEETQVKCFLGALREGVVFGLLGAQAYGGSKLNFPTARGTVHKK